MPAYNLDQSYDTGQDNADGSGIGNLRRAANNNTKVAQSFTPTLLGPTNRIELYMKKVGSPTGNIAVEIRADGADPSSATLYATSSNVDVSTVSTSYVYQAFDFSSPPTLTPGVKYWAILTGTYTEAIDVGVYVGIDTTSPSYSGGNYGRYGNGSAAWEDVSTYDMLFKQYSDNAATSGGSFLLNFI